ALDVRPIGPSLAFDEIREDERLAPPAAAGPLAGDRERLAQRRRAALRSPVAEVDLREAAEGEHRPVDVAGLARDGERAREAFRGAGKVAPSEAHLAELDDRERPPD